MKYNYKEKQWELKLDYGTIIKMNKPKTKDGLWTYLIIDDKNNHYCLYYMTLPKHTIMQW